MRGGRSVRHLAPFVVAALLVAACSASDPGVKAVSVAPTGGVDLGPLALDPDVLTGELDNGLTYFIRSNDRPGGQAELRLAVNAGSALEDEDQSGVAHFLEHMMFNGTEKYEKNAIVDVLQRGGSSFGADVNAYTSYDETVYQLNVSNTDDEIDTGLDILHEWLTAVTLDPAEVERERGVVLGEYRDRELTADGRVSGAIADLYLAGSAYDGRAPIGTEAAISAMTPELLRRFWDDWYRPDNVAVVVVGDIEPDDIERRIEEMFGVAAPRSDVRERPALGWPVPDAPRAAVVTDADLVTAAVELALPTEATDASLGSTVVDQITDAVAMTAIADRLRTDISESAAPFNSVDASSSSFVRPLDAPSVYLSANSGDAPAATQSLLDEFARVLQFGLHVDDVDRAVTEIRSFVEADYERRDTVQDANYADSLVAHFLAGSPSPSADVAYAAAVAVLDGLDAAAVNARLTTRFGAGHPVLAVTTTPGVEGLPDSAALEVEMADLLARPVEDRATVAAGATSLMVAPEPAEVSDSGRLPSRLDFFIDPSAFTFDNGVTVILNPTDIVDDRIEILGISPGGFSATDPADAPAVWLMNEVNSESGFGDLSQVDVDRILSSSTVDVMPFPSANVEVFNGSSSTDDLELALQTIHLFVTGSNFDEGALERAVDRNLGYVADPESDPDLATQIALNDARYGNDPRRRVVLTSEDLAPITADQLARVWQERFGNAADWVYVLSGDFELDTAIDLAARYLGTLPSTGETEERVDVTPPPPAGVVTREVRAGSGDTAQLLVQYTAASDGSAAERIHADLLTEVLSNRLTERIREELGASYSPSAFVAVDPGPPAEVVTGFSISGAPDDMENLAAVLQEELASLRSDGPSPDDLTKAIAVVKEQYGLIDDTEIIDTIVRWLDDDQAIDDYANAYDDVEDVTVDDLRTFIARALPAGQYIQITQLPR
ncbi:MAG: insulinase family protein [Actinobacteria bacterium]|nr:insulinase family protein [Actinomycetota bacterium]